MDSRTQPRLRQLALALAGAVVCGVVACGVHPAGGAPDAGSRDSASACRPDNETAAGEPGPSLASLDISAKGESKSVLVPEFSVGTRDYYVTCAAGTNAFSVSYRVEAGSKASLSVETPSNVGAAYESVGGPQAQQTLSLSLDEGQALVVTFCGAKGTQAYWVRCLPHDFPPMRWVVDAGCPSPPGYYLLGNLHAAESGPYAMVLDRHGVPVWYLRLPAQTSAWNVDSFDGGISFVPFGATSRGYEVHRLSPPGTTTIQPRGWPIDPHDMRPLANGHFLVLSDRVQTGVDLTGFHARGPDGGVQSFGADSSILPCDILEVDAAGNVWWTWFSTDHLDPVKDTTLQVLYRGPDGVLTPDPFHCNSIDVDPANGNILVSARQMDSIFYIDRASGDILWKMGGVDYTKDGAVYVPLSSADSFHRQHDARLQGGWSTTCGGEVSVFDDESGTGSAARAAVYDVSLGGADSCRSRPNARLSWQWAGIKTSYAMGSFRITSDGSRVIGWGTEGIPGLVFTEVDEAGDRLLDLYFTDESASFRAVKAPLDAMDLNVLRQTAGLAEP